MNKLISLEEHIKIIAKEIFKFTELRPGQMDAIKYYVENKKDTLVIMKTGGGKSFCYAIASILFDGLTVVISPLKSLIQNQVVSINIGSLKLKNKINNKYLISFIFRIILSN